ncbi:hypothetical protein HanRHA438_Chr13g0599281 [Helianthus annuus]|nr:hypothetical protein HanRHA438_Chr13g0599281 [Helianthus annuus]
MKSIGSVALLHPQDSLNNHPDNHHLLSTPHKSHRSYPSLTTGNKRPTPNKKINNRHTDSNNRSEFFAGSVFVDSPPPSSVPIPGFFTKNFVSGVKDDPTTELRRILGLNLS